MHVTMELLGSPKNKITKDETGKNVPLLEITEAVLVHWNIINDDYQRDSRHLYTFVPNNSLGHLLGFSPKRFIFLKTFNSSFSFIEKWFTDQNL